MQLRPHLLVQIEKIKSADKGVDSISIHNLKLRKENQPEQHELSCRKKRSNLRLGRLFSTRAAGKSRASIGRLYLPDYLQLEV